jgi:hypothetical protein
LGQRALDDRFEREIEAPFPAAVDIDGRAALFHGRPALRNWLGGFFIHGVPHLVLSIF